MSWVAAAMAATQVASGLFSFGAASSARKKMRKNRKAQMMAHDVDTKYNLGQMEAGKVQTEGLIEAQIGASNLQFKGTPMYHKSAVSQQLASEIANYKTQAAAQRKNIRYTGSAAMQAVKNQGTSSLIGSFGQAASYSISAYNKSKKD